MESAPSYRTVFQGCSEHRPAALCIGKDTGRLFIIETVYREVSVDRNTATETQTLKQGREGRKPGREPKENEAANLRLRTGFGPKPSPKYPAQYRMMQPKYHGQADAKK